ncbi:sensory transduction histidine kinase, putative, partial [Ricinus communis]
QYEREQALIEKESAERASLAKTQFLAQMSHELRTPLNSILGFARLLELNLRNTLSAPQLRQLRSIETSGRDLLHLINEILDISRIESGNIRLAIDDVPLHPLLEKIDHQMQPVATEAGIAMHIAMPTDLIVRADPQRLQQILTNLLSNAVKYNRADGAVHLHAFRHGDIVRIEVQDEGEGLSAVQIRELFQPFNRLGAERSHVEGTGLGLVIVRALAEQMHGRLDVRSEVGKGATFIIELPIGDAAAVVSPAFTSPSPPPVAVSSELRRVLYVEDNPVNVLLMEALFELRPHYRLTIAIDAASAQREIAARKPHLILMDMHLPDANGIELFDTIRRTGNCNDIPIIAVSADAMPEDIDVALRAGFQDYWTKPLNIDVALRALDRLLMGGAPRPSGEIVQQTQQQQQ